MVRAMRKRWTTGELVLNVALTVIAVVLAILFFIQLTTRRIPRRYMQTMSMSQEKKQALSNQFLNKLLRIQQLRASNAPFEETITDEMVNAYLLRDFASLGEFLPSEIVNPQIHFDENAIVMMGMFTPRNFHPMVVSVYLKPIVNYDGALRLELTKVKGGALRIPKRIVGETLDFFNDVATVLPNVEIEVTPGNLIIRRNPDKS